MPGKTFTREEQHDDHGEQNAGRESNDERGLEIDVLSFGRGKHLIQKETCCDHHEQVAIASQLRIDAPNLETILHFGVEIKCVGQEMQP